MLQRNFPEEKVLCCTPRGLHGPIRPEERPEAASGCHTTACRSQRCLRSGTHRHTHMSQHPMRWSGRQYAVDGGGDATLTAAHNARAFRFGDTGTKRRQKRVCHVLITDQRIESLRLRKLPILSDRRAQIEPGEVFARRHRFEVTRG